MKDDNKEHTVKNIGEKYFHERTKYLLGLCPIIDSMSQQNLSIPIENIKTNI